MKKSFFLFTLLCSFSSFAGFKLDAQCNLTIQSPNNGARSESTWKTIQLDSDGMNSFAFSTTPSWDGYSYILVSLNKVAGLGIGDQSVGSQYLVSVTRMSSQNVADNYLDKVVKVSGKTSESLFIEERTDKNTVLFQGYDFPKKGRPIEYSTKEKGLSISYKVPRTFPMGPQTFTFNCDMKIH